MTFRSPRSFLLCVWILAAALTACSDDEGTGPRPDPATAALFERYVSLGNSITAGFQSGGIYEATQRESYPVLLAEQAGVDFAIPALAAPGCPPPVVDPLTLERLGGGTAQSCAGRVSPRPPLVQNLAVPGAKLEDALIDRGQIGNPLTSRILEGRTQVEAMVAARPTLITVMLGNNDVLYALDGDTALMTPVQDFAASLALLVQEIRRAEAIEVVILSVIDPLLAPAIQPGAFYWVAARTGVLPVEVSDNCAPGAAGAANLVSGNAVLTGTGRVDCGDQARFVLNAAERAAVTRRTDAYNARLRIAAQENDWIFVDVNSVSQALAADPAKLRKCQSLAGATTEGAATQAVLATCPGPLAPGFFGPLISYDGVHPSEAGQQVIANAIAVELNRKHGTRIAQR